MLYCLLRFLHRVSSEEPNYTLEDVYGQYFILSFFNYFLHLAV